MTAIISSLDWIGTVHSDVDHKSSSCKDQEGLGPNFPINKYWIKFVFNEITFKRKWYSS